MRAIRVAALVLAVAALSCTASADGIPMVTPYPIGSIPSYHHPTVPYIPHHQLLFPSTPPYFPQKKILPFILPGLIGSLPYQHPDDDIAAILSSPLLDTILPLSAEAPTPGTSEAFAPESESAPAVAPSRSKSLITRKASPRKHLQAQDRNRAAILAALGDAAPAPAPASAEGPAPALGPIPSDSFNAFFASLNSQELAPAPALEGAISAAAPLVAPGVVVGAPGVSVVAPGVDVNVPAPLPQPTPVPSATSLLTPTPADLNIPAANPQA